MMRENVYVRIHSIQQLIFMLYAYEGREQPLHCIPLIPDLGMLFWYNRWKSCNCLTGKIFRVQMVCVSFGFGRLFVCTNLNTHWNCLTIILFACVLICLIDWRVYIYELLIYGNHRSLDWKVFENFKVFIAYIN